MNSPSKKIMISLPEDLLKDIDDVAAAEHRSRSGLVREATREYVAKRRRKRPVDDPKVREAIRVMDEIAERYTVPFDSTKVIREMRDSRYGPKKKPSG